MSDEFEVLSERLDRLEAARAQNIVEGGCKDFAAYRHACGVIEGLALAQREIRDLAKYQQELEDADD